MSGNGVGLDVSFGLELAVGELTKEMKRQRRLAQLKDMQSRLEVPRDTRVNLAALGAGNNVFPSSGNLILYVDGPQEGVFWEVHEIVVGGAAANAAPAGTAYVHISGAPPTDLSLATAKDFSQTPFPVKGTWGTRAFVLRPQQNLYVTITGGTVGTTYAAFADITEIPETPLMATVAVE